jgi:hypothetical protein
MENENSITRRVAVKSSLFGLLAVSIPNVLFAKQLLPVKKENKLAPGIRLLKKQWFPRW